MTTHFYNELNKLVFFQFAIDDDQRLIDVHTVEVDTGNEIYHGSVEFPDTTIDEFDSQTREFISKIKASVDSVKISVN